MVVGSGSVRQCHCCSIRIYFEAQPLEQRNEEKALGNRIESMMDETEVSSSRASRGISI